jgi:predicted ArsR family transcriptional regulator
MKPTTRLRILDHIRRHQTASVRELSHSLGMTGANIRHHLAVLESNDLIEMVSQRREGRGRPRMVYGLSRHALGDGLDELSAALLGEWLAGLPDREQEAGLRSLAGRMRAGFAGQADGAALSLSKGPLPKRLTEAVRFLNQVHYQARWEAGAAGPRVILGHCPFSAIIAKHPELCRMDAFLLEGCIGQPAEQSARLEQGGQGLPQCVFLVK